jgi:DNA invertase Pin-like site-specific DNA recombinase
VLQADDLAVDPGTRIRARPVVFYGRTAHAADTQESQAERDRQLALCRAAVAAYGGQVTAVYFDEGCRADHPWSRRPHGQALLATLSGTAHPARTLVAADAWRLPPRRTPADGTRILQRLAQHHVLLMLADTGVVLLTAEEYALLGRLMSGIAGSAPATALAGMPSRPLPSAARSAARQPRR